MNLFFNFYLFVTFTIILIQYGEAKKMPVADLTEINQYLFNDSKSTMLDDFKKGIVTTRGDVFSKKEVDNGVKFVFYSFNFTEKLVSQFTYENRNDTVLLSYMKEDVPLRVVIHGWTNKIDSPMISKIVTAYEDSNFNGAIMVVDWSAFAFEKYWISRDVINDVADTTARFLKYLFDNKLASLQNTYLIGHSLGAHTVGLVGKKLQELGSGKIPKIFGLDPAGPLFDPNNKDTRLDKDDGEFVIVIHTSTILGYTEPLGDVDFYPNFGWSQPGCGPDLVRHCAHARVYEYFSEAIQVTDDENAFWTVKCNSNYDDIEAETCEPTDVRIKLDESLEKNEKTANGIFYFSTNDKAPWAKGQLTTFEELASSPDTGSNNEKVSNEASNIITQPNRIILIIFSGILIILKNQII